MIVCGCSSRVSGDVGERAAAQRGLEWLRERWLAGVHGGRLSGGGRGTRKRGRRRRVGRQWYQWRSVGR